MLHVVRVATFVSCAAGDALVLIARTKTTQKRGGGKSYPKLGVEERGQAGFWGDNSLQSPVGTN